MKIAVFPGSFDPFTKGHEALVLKASNLFDKVIIAIGENTSKSSYYDLDIRIKHIKSLFETQNIEVKAFKGLTVDFCKSEGASFILRGLRDVKDFEYEKSIAFMNIDLAKIETVFLLTELKYMAINSSIVREIAKSDGDISKFVSSAHLLRS